MEGRDDLLERVTVALERSADANQRLIEIAEKEQLVEVEHGPSLCPGCGKMNPTVTALETDGHGPLDEFVLVAETDCCHRTIYAVPDNFFIVMHRDEAKAILIEKGGRVSA